MLFQVGAVLCLSSLKSDGCEKNISLIFLLLLFMVSCGNKQSETFDDQVSLVGSDVLSFPLDETTYYESKAIFQFENEGREYLFFRMKEKGEASYLDI